MGRSNLLGPLIALGAVAGFTLLDGGSALGAHPFWTVKIGFIGAGIGFGTWLTLHVIGATRRQVVLLGTVLFLASSTAAWLGKMRFVASYAEDHLAGRFWFVGWMMAIGAIFLLIATLANPDRKTAGSQASGKSAA